MFAKAKTTLLVWLGNKESIFQMLKWYHEIIILGDNEMKQSHKLHCKSFRFSTRNNFGSESHDTGLLHERHQLKTHPSLFWS